MIKKKSILFSIFKKRKNIKNKEKYGFTLIELLVVVAIIGALSTMLFIKIDFFGISEDANVAKTVHRLESIKSTVAMYVIDTGYLPPTCRINSDPVKCCNADNDPFLNALGRSGWNGPYLKEGIYNLTHAWGGQIGILTADLDLPSDGLNEVWLVLDDDAPGCDYSDNSGEIPLNALEKINDLVDIDSDLGDGIFFRGESAPFADGEGAWRVYRVGQQ